MEKNEQVQNSSAEAMDVQNQAAEGKKKQDVKSVILTYLHDLVFLLAGILLVVSFILMMLVWAPGIGVTVNMSSRWIRIKPFPTIQPSEIAKFALIIFLANLFTVGQNEMNKGKILLPAIFITAIFCVMLFKQPNLSMLMTYLMVLWIMMCVAGTKWYYLLIPVAIAVVVERGGSGADVQFIARDIILAHEVLPVPRVPTNKYA